MAKEAAAHAAACKDGVTRKSWITIEATYRDMADRLEHRILP